MKLKSLTVENFRQFYGTQTIYFSADANANVTVIHGENGSGKTALLNTFKWAFYGTTDFETNDEKSLLSERLVAETSAGAPMEVNVIVVFEHDDNEHTASRSAKFTKSNDGQISQIGRSSLALSFLGEDGSYQNSPNPETHINQILPSRMHPYFFFNGERIEKLSAMDSSKDVQTAIKGMMGLEILERARGHLTDHVIKKFRKELKESSASDLSLIIEQESALYDQKDALAGKLENLYESQRHNHTRRSDINKRMKEIGPIAELQRERLETESDLDRIIDDINSLRKERLELLGNSSFLVFSPGLVEAASQLLDDRRNKGELPTKIKSQFLDDLLKAERCICGRPLLPGDESTNCLIDFKSTEVLADVEDAFIRTSGSLTAMKTGPAKFRTLLKGLNERLETLQSSKNKKNGRLDEISSEIGNSKTADAEALEANRDEMIAKISNVDQEIGRQRTKLENLGRELTVISEKRRELTKRGDAEEKATNRLDAAEEVASILNDLYVSLSEKVRGELSEVVDTTFRNIMKKNYWAEIAPDYSLRIKKKVGDHTQEVLDKSTGEAQVTSLSFIGGLVSLAKTRHGANTQYYKGGLFPIVMDSPYGNLDPEYRNKVAEAIPNLAEQVVLLVSNSQWRNEVQHAVGLKTGNEYTLIYHTPDRKKDTITNSVVGDSEYEFTEIREGYYE
jgi:DNA sulfur modification protein DndD